MLQTFFGVIYVTIDDFDLDYADSDVIMSKRGFYNNWRWLDTEKHLDL
jgi:hypothetical protein